MSAKIALFVDVESMHSRLRSLHHRSLDPAILLETAREHGELAHAVALGDWGALPEDLKGAFEAAEVDVVQVDRVPREGARRREVVRDLVDLEMMARMVEVLFEDGGPEVDAFVLATADDVAARAAGLVRGRFNKSVHVVGVEGAACERLQGVATGWEPLPLPPVEPTNIEGLEKLVPLLEDLERKKRYLNFKYIRETSLRKLDLPDRSFEVVEALLSEAIACGILLKIKVEDKYNPGQRFTAYALNREGELFQRFGSGEPAPVHEDPPEPPEEEELAIPTLARRSSAPAAPSKKEEPEPSADDEDGRDGGGRRRRRRRKKPAAATPEPVPTQLAAGSSARAGKKRNNKRRSRGNGHQQDRVGRTYEAPSRFLDLSDEEPPLVDDDDLDEEQILQARGDSF